MHRGVGIVCLALALAALLAACNDEEEGHVVEGEPLELGDLLFNVQITRFLNPTAEDDAGYLAGEEPPRSEQQYLGVFVKAENEGDSPVNVPEDFEVVDTQGNRYEPLPSESPYALELGQTVPPEGEIPVPDSTAFAGPIKGSMLLFLVDRGSAQNRPLELEVRTAAGESSTVVLDI